MTTNSASSLIYSCLSSFVFFGLARDAHAYSKVPKNTNAAPKDMPVFHPLPKYHTLKQRLSALRVVRTRLVVTEDTRYEVE